jgi:hypothetical protein
VVTALDDRPPTWALPSKTNRWEWHEFEADGWAHLYRVAELDNLPLELLRPWCLLGERYPLEHDRPSIKPDIVIPQRGRTCPACGVHVWARIPHPAPVAPPSASSPATCSRW